MRRPPPDLIYTLLDKTSSPVHHMACDHESSVRALSSRDLQRSRRGTSPPSRSRQRTWVPPRGRGPARSSRCRSPDGSAPCGSALALCRLQTRPNIRTLRGRKLRQTFDSWGDLGANYLIGRQFWSPALMKRDGQLYRSAYQKLLSDPQSP